MGYYTDTLSSYREENISSLSLAQRMEVVKKAVELDLAKQVEDKKTTYFASSQIPPYSVDRRLGETIRQAQNKWSETVMMPTEKFFAGAISQEVEGLCAHFDSGLEEYKQTQAKIEKVENGKGFAGVVGKVIPAAKDYAVQSLSSTLDCQREALEGLQDALQDFQSLSKDDKAEFIVARYEQTGSLEYNAEDVSKYYAQNNQSEQTTSCDACPEQ